MTERLEPTASFDAAPPTSTPPPAVAEAPAPRRRSPLRWAIALVVGAALAFTLLLLAVLTWYTPQLPSLEPVLAYQPRQPMQVFTREGIPIAEFGTERRQFVPLDKIPKLVKDSVLAVEDTRFYEHHGVDYKGLGRAFVAQLTGGMRQGASTITQQVARTFLLSQKFTFDRKIKEFLLALDIDRQLPKDRILELYLNQIYLGQRAYGFAAAADAYFGKTLDELTVGEVAMLAGLPQNPAFANPLADPERAAQRQRVVLQRMVAERVITPAQQEQAKTAKLEVGRRARHTMTEAQYVAELARRAMVERFGDAAYARGLKITTSIVAKDQQWAWDALRRGILNYDSRRPWRGPEETIADLPAGDKDSDWERTLERVSKDIKDDEVLRAAIVLQSKPDEIRAMLLTGQVVRIRGDGLRFAQPGLNLKSSSARAIKRGSVIRVAQRGNDRNAWQVVQWPEVQAALVAMDSDTGRVRALVGGFDFDHQPFNHVTQAWRQPGSSFKPFIYSAALETGIAPGTLVDDAELEFPNGWEPQNYDGRFDGPMSLRKGLTRSKNMVSIRVLQETGIGRTLDWLQRFGFDRERHPVDLTLALGAGAVTPLQMAAGYAVFANGGWYVPPVVVEKVVDADGNVVYEAPQPAAKTEDNRAINAANVFMTNSMLYDVTRWGTAARAQQELSRRDVFGKTGTTNDSYDAWFAGFKPGLVGVVWMGYDQPASLGARETGGGLALPIWLEYMGKALRGQKELDTPKPPKTVTRVEDDWRRTDGPKFVKGVDIDWSRVQRARPKPPVVDDGADPEAPRAAAHGNGSKPATAPAKPVATTRPPWVTDGSQAP